VFSRTVQGTFREQSGNTQGTFRELSENIQGTFREHSGNIQRTSGNIHPTSSQSGLQQNKTLNPKLRVSKLSYWKLHSLFRLRI
jgi:hypothetical protein